MEYLSFVVNIALYFLGLLIFYAAGVKSGHKIGYREGWIDRGIRFGRIAKMLDPSQDDEPDEPIIVDSPRCCICGGHVAGYAIADSEDAYCAVHGLIPHMRKSF